MDSKLEKPDVKARKNQIVNFDKKRRFVLKALLVLQKAFVNFVILLQYNKVAMVNKMVQTTSKHWFKFTFEKSFMWHKKCFENFKPGHFLTASKIIR